MNDMIIDPNKINFAQYLEDQSFLEAQSIKDVTDFADDVAEFADTGDSAHGATLPWGKTHQFTRVGDGKLSIWAGVNGSGKSLILGQVITGLMLQGRRAVIASLEMHPKQTIYRMICQSATCKASREYSLKWMERFRGKFF
jgi:twinkle protein